MRWLPITEKQWHSTMRWLPIPFLLMGFAILSKAPTGRVEEGLPPEGVSQVPRSPAQDSLPELPEWKMVKLDDFYFYLPPDMIDQKAGGTDSEVWEFRNDEIRLSIDYGYFSNPLTLYNEQHYFHEELLTVDGREAKISSFKLTEEFSSPADEEMTFIAAIHFPNTDNIAPGTDDNPRKLTFWANCKDENAQEITRSIFRTIRFNESVGAH